MAETIVARIAQLEAYRAELGAKQAGAWEFNRPEQDARARMYRDGWRQAFEGIDNSLAFYRQRLAELSD